MAKDRASRATIWRTVADGIRTGIPVLLTAGLMLMALAAAGQVVIPTINVSTVPLPTGLYQMTTSSGSAGSPPVSVAVISGSDRSVQVICLEACAWAQPEAFGWAVASDITADPSRTTVPGLNGKVNAGQFKGTVSGATARSGSGGALVSLTVTLARVASLPSLPVGNYVLIYDSPAAVVTGYTLSYANAMVIRQGTDPSIDMKILQPPGFLPSGSVMPFLFAPRSGNLIGDLTPSPASSGTEQPSRIAGVTADGQLLGMDLVGGTTSPSGVHTSGRNQAYWRASFVAGSGNFTLPAGGYAFSGDNLLGVTAAVRALPSKMLGFTFAGAPEIYCEVDRNHIGAGGSNPLLSGVLVGDGQLVTSGAPDNIFTGGAGQGVERETGLIHPQTATNSLPDGIYQLQDFNSAGKGAWTKGTALAVMLKNSGGHVMIDGQDKTMSAAWDCSFSNNLLQCLQGGDVTYADFIGVLTGPGQAVGSHFTSKADTASLSGLKKAELKWISATPPKTTASPAAGLPPTPVTRLQNPPASTSSGAPTQPLATLPQTTASPAAGLSPTPVTQLQNPPVSTSSGASSQPPKAKPFPDCANTFAFTQGMLWAVTYLGKTDTWTVHDVPHPEYPDSGNFVDLKGNTFTYQIDCNGVDLTGEPGEFHLPGTLSADHKTATLSCTAGDTECVDQFGKIIKVTIH